MSIIVFYCNDSMENIQAMEYYRQDIEALKALGHEVVVCNRYRDIPLQFDLMFIWWWTYALYPILLAKLLRRKSVVAGVFNFRFQVKSQGADYFARPVRQRLMIWLAAKLADANLFVSEKEFQEVPPYFRLKRVFYFPCAVGEEYFHVRNRAGSRQDLLNIAWSGAGNLKRKGVWDILDAMKLLKERGVSASLTLAGKLGDGFPALERRISELGLQDRVRAVGEVSKEEKLRLFAQAKLYLQPSYFEGFGLATAEAMAAGCCVITCDVGEVRNVVADGGHYVKPGDPAELASAIEALLADDSTVASFNERSASRLQALFSFQKKTSTLGLIIRSIG
jgi:glycosyltransferase involved in cell wall biosynthesis